MSDRTVRLHRVLRAPPQRVYRAFLEPGALAKWLPPYGFTCTVHHLEARVGGTFRMSFHNFAGGGGHSFGGRMTTTAQSEEPIENVAGLVLFSFPLHLPGRPDTKRDEHLVNIKVPMLFLSGTRDELATLDLLKPAVKMLGKHATLHLIDTANHSYKVLKKSRSSDEDVFAEMARVTDNWAASKLS